MKFIVAMLLAGLFAISAIAEVKKPEIRIRDLEHRIHDLVNDERNANGRSRLLLDEKLSSVAREHSQDMAKRGYFDHVDPAGKTPRKRVESVGISCNTVGENIFQNNLYTSFTIKSGRKSYDWSTMEQIASTTVMGWMASPGHRKNIVSKDYLRGGLGVAIAMDDKVYITQVFCD
jgi:uncharacterized protein YkwD